MNTNKTAPNGSRHYYTHNDSAREKICHIFQNRRNSLIFNTIKTGR